MLHTMYFADEVRSFAEIDKGQSAKIKDGELALAQQLIDGLSNAEFEPDRYADDYRQRVLDLVESKVEGKEITTVGPPVQRAQVIDLMEALKESIAKRVAPGDKKPPAKVTRRAEAKTEPAPAKKAQAGRK
jgi:DNA end-binding protein Ku